MTDHCTTFSKMATERDCAVYLIPRDSSSMQQERFPIPGGDTSIGRGPFLKITDRRVSRAHAVLRSKDGKVALFAKHSNPCYYTRAGQDEVQIVQKDHSCELKAGDRFSLLPDCLVFEVATASNTAMQDDNVILEELLPLDKANEQPSTSSLSSAALHSKPASNSCKETPMDTSAFDNNSGPSKQQEQVVKGLQDSDELSDKDFCRQKDAKTVSKEELQQSQAASELDTNKLRKLPSWMTCIEASSSSTTASSSSKIVKAKKETTSSKVKGKTAAIKEKKLSSRPRPPAKMKSSSVDLPVHDDHDIDDRSAVKDDHDSDDRSAVKDGNDDDEYGSTVPPANKKPNTRVDDCPMPPIVDAEHHSAKEESPPVGEKEKTSDDLPSRSGGQSDSVSAAAKPLPPCPYGKQCYRKNPAHFNEYSHGLDPANDDEDDEGDADVGNDSEDSDKQQCPYGAACYRNNPAHRKQYRHTAATSTTKRSQRSARAKRSMKDKESDDDSQPNTYDYNDSFIDDVSLDSDDDVSDDSSTSDENWLPNDRDSGDDVTDLNKEAASFIGNKKMHK